MGELSPALPFAQLRPRKGPTTEPTGAFEDVSFHCYDRFVKVSFYKGAELSPPPVVTSKFPTIRYHHVHAGEELVEKFADWVRQAGKLPGVKM